MLQSEDKHQMLTFAPLLFIAASVVDLDASSYQSPKECKEFGTSVRSSSVSRSRQVTQRLKIFESITKSEDQRNEDSSVSIEYEQGIFAPDDDQTVNEILRHSLVELTEILRKLDSNDPSKAMIIPLHVIPMHSPESLVVFQSLLMMLTNSKESGSLMPWQQYLEESISKQQCSVMGLHRAFEKNFKCDQEGHLTVIGLDGKGPYDHLDLLMIPNTVSKVLLRNTKLKTISGWTDLKGKSLKTLCLDANFDLKLNLDGFNGELNHLPLKHMTVSTRSITNYFGEADGKRAFAKIGNWMRTSTLTSLRLKKKTGGVPRTVAIFDSDGSWTLNERN